MNIWAWFDYSRHQHINRVPFFPWLVPPPPLLSTSNKSTAGCLAPLSVVTRSSRIPLTSAAWDWVTTQESSTIPPVHHITGVPKAVVMSRVQCYLGVSVGPDVTDPWKKIWGVVWIGYSERNWIKEQTTINYINNSSYFQKMEAMQGKGKAIPWQAWTGPEGSRRLRLLDFKIIGTWRW